MTVRRAGTLVGVAAVAALAAATAGGASAASAGARAPAGRLRRTSLAAPLEVPLDTTTTTDAGTWLIGPMGDLSQPANTFWELFLLPAGSSRWYLRTPPGIATNGGLVASGGDTHRLAVGLRGSDLLEFSPVVTSGAGLTWSSGLVGSDLAASANALASDSSGRLLALLGAHDGEVLQSSGNLTSWSLLTTARSLGSSKAATGCRVAAVTAVDWASSGAPLVGTTCDSPGTAGLFERTSTGSWAPEPIHLQGSERGDRVTVARLVDGVADGGGSSGGVAAGGGSPAALLTLSGSSGRAVVLAWPGAGGAWRTSPELPVPVGATLESTGPARGGIYVVVSEGGRSTAEVLAGPGASWHRLATLPKGAGLVAFPTGTRIDAVGLRGSSFTAWRLDAGGSGWTTIETQQIPIEYGSSS